MTELVSQIRRLHDRWKYYQEAPTLESLAELLQDAEDLEWNPHDECRTDDDLDHARREAERECEDKIKELEERIDELEGEVSDLRADAHVYAERLKKGDVAARLAENFIFTPEDARAQFRCVRGGVC